MTSSCVSIITFTATFSMAVVVPTSINTHSKKPSSYKCNEKQQLTNKSVTESYHERGQCHGQLINHFPVPAFVYWSCWQSPQITPYTVWKRGRVIICGIGGGDNAARLKDMKYLSGSNYWVARGVISLCRLAASDMGIECWMCFSSGKFYHIRWSYSDSKPNSRGGRAERMGSMCNSSECTDKDRLS